MEFALGPKATSEGYRIAAFETIGSTSTEAMARGRAGDPGRLWVVAGAQTEGHGRRGRAWETPRGNLAASLLLRVRTGQAHAATLGFAAGLALEEAVLACASEIAFRVALDGAEGADARLRLKWPNDVLVDGAKVAGILLEAHTVPGEANSVVVGFGVNVRHAPDGLPYPATSLARCGASVSAGELFEALAEAWVGHERMWDGGQGFAAIRGRWLESAAGLGAPIAVRAGEDVLRGTFETIDEEGRLVVRREDGTMRTVSAGEVHFGAAATAERSHAR